MKLHLPCSHCLFELRNGSQWHGAKPIGDTCIYEVMCPQGHTSQIIVQNYKFEMLFESGIKALKDEYYREAVTSFAVALERFYEFAILVLMMHKHRQGVDGPIDENAVRAFEKFWKVHLKFSERQIGAFYILYLEKYGEAPVIFDQAFSKKNHHSLVTNPVNFRNRVIHEGYIPTYDEALQYGEAVHLYIDGLLRVLTADDGRRVVASMHIIESALALIKRGEAIRSIPATAVETLIRSVDSSYYSNRLSLVEYIANGCTYYRS